MIFIFFELLCSHLKNWDGMLYLVGLSPELNGMAYGTYEAPTLIGLSS